VPFFPNPRVKTLKKGLSANLHCGALYPQNCDGLSPIFSKGSGKKNPPLGEELKLPKSN